MKHLLGACFLLITAAVAYSYTYAAVWFTITLHNR